MAYTAQLTQTGGILAAIWHPFNRIGKALMLAAESNERLRRAQVLQDMSDEELAARGLKREDIVRTVFADVLYL